MDCLRISIEAEFIDIPKIRNLDFNAINEFISSERPLHEIHCLESPYLKLPDPLANSDPPKKGTLLRGPPLV